MVTIDKAPRAQAAAVKGRIAWKDPVEVVSVAIAAALLLVSFLRAADASLVHDEAASYDIVMQEASRYAGSLNNHLLNTWCMSASSSLFGTSELALRVHTVLAHGLYLVCSVLVLRHVETRSARVAGFALLNLNLFVLDYMFLARGYGMAMGFQLLSMLALLKAAGRGASHGTIKLLVIAVGAAGLAVLANVSFLNYMLPACAVAAVLAYRQRSAIKIRKGTIVAAAVALAGLGLVVAVAVSRVMSKWAAGQLSWGKQGDVVVPVMRSLVRAWIHEPDPADGMLMALVLAVAVLMVGAVACAAWRIWRTRTLGSLEWVVLIGLGSVGLAVAQHHLLSTALPAERHGLVFVAPWMLAIALALGRVGAGCRSRWLAAVPASMCVTITAVMCVRFVTGLELGRTYTWPYESNSKDAMRRIDEDRRVRYPEESISVGIYWALEPSMSYYRDTRGFTWMKPLVQGDSSEAPIGETGHHYLYVFDWQRYSLPETEHVIMALYPDSKTALLRVERPRGPGGVDPPSAGGVEGGGS